MRACFQEGISCDTDTRLAQHPSKQKSQKRSAQIQKAVLAKCLSQSCSCRPEDFCITSSNQILKAAEAPCTVC